MQGVFEAGRGFGREGRRTAGAARVGTAVDGLRDLLSTRQFRDVLHAADRTERSEGFAVLPGRDVVPRRRVRAVLLPAEPLLAGELQVYENVAAARARRGCSDTAERASLGGRSGRVPAVLVARSGRAAVADVAARPDRAVRRDRLGDAGLRRSPGRAETRGDRKRRKRDMKTSFPGGGVSFF